MRLRDLDADFIAVVDAAARTHRRAEGIEGAAGVMFQCPKCGEGLERGEEDGRRFIRGAHYIMVCFANPIGASAAPTEFDHNPRWLMEGSSLDDLTLSPSVNCDIPWKDAAGVEHPSSCKFHGWVKNGDAA
jgi:hypothetical protein